MIDLFLFLGGAFLLTFLIGRLLEKIRVPWIFAALLIGAFLSIHNPFDSVTSSKTFEFMAQLGMYFLLFIIGFEIDLRKFKKSSKFILQSTFFIIFLEGLFGSLLIHFVFGYSWFISFLVALSFATVGEAILIPILDEFRIINTKLGQSIIGIGTFDDIIEIFLLILLGVLIGTKANSPYSGIIMTFVFIGILFLLTISLKKLKKQDEEFRFLSIGSLFILIISVLFVFLGIGQLANAAPIAALLAGIGLNTFIPDNRVDKIKTSVKALCYGFFAPIFFLWVGTTMDVKYLFSSPLLILLVVVVSSTAKILGSYIIGKKELGKKESVLLGIGLSVRFSTSIIIIKILFENGLIKSGLYSIILASSIVFTFIVPVLFSNLIVRWKIAKNN